MKLDVLILPNDTVIAGAATAARVIDGAGRDSRMPPFFFLDLLRAAYVSAHCSAGFTAYRAGCESCAKHGACDAESVAGAWTADPSSIGLKISSQLMASGVGGRVEPLYPVPDDLLVDPGPRDAVWAQPAYLETVGGDVLHDAQQLRLLVPSSRLAGAGTFDAWLTRKGVRVWAERKPQRLSEGEHYLPPRRLFDVEVRNEGSEALVHLRVRPGIGFMVSAEIPDGRPALPLPATISGLRNQRAVRIEAVQFPLPAFDSKPRKKWRLTVLSDTPCGASGLPSWIDPAERKTLAPVAAGGKLVAIARRRVEPTEIEAAAPACLPAARSNLIPAGTTFFIDYEEPVRIEPPADILAGGS